MAKWKEGDRVRVISRDVTAEDKKLNRYFDHMKGLVGSVQGVYEGDEIAVQVEMDSLSKVTKTIHDEATKRMRARFLDEATEEIKGRLTATEMNFNPNHVILVQASDLEKA